MIKRKLKTIEGWAGASGLLEKYKDVEIEGVSIDTRKIIPGNLFVPIVGDRFNGHDFLDQALESGAVACLWQKDIPLPKIDFPFLLVEDSLEALQLLSLNYRKELEDLTVIGITGSNGKTSTKDILDGILSVSYRTKKTQGNLNNHLGVPLTLLDFDEETEIGIVEMGTDGFGQIELLTSLALPDIALITNIGASHLDLLKTKENVARAKFEILKGLDQEGIFLYNGDDPVLKKIIQEYEIPQRVYSFGQDESNSFRLEMLAEGREGINFKILAQDLKGQVHLPMIGPHNLYNGGASVFIGSFLGLDLDKIQEGLYHIESTGMRNEIIETDYFTILNDAYKSNPSSLLAALDTLYSIDGYKSKCLVLGDMLDLGDDIVELHREIGPKIDPEKVDKIFTYGDLAQHISDAAKENFPKENIFHLDSKDQLFESVSTNIDKDSLVLIKASRSVKLEELIDRLKK